MSATAEVRQPAKRSASAEVVQRKSILAALLSPDMMLAVVSLLSG